MSSNYPPGARFDSNAPYNQPEIPVKEYTVTVSFTTEKLDEELINELSDNIKSIVDIYSEYSSEVKIKEN